MLIQSEAILRKARVRFKLRNLKTASNWISMFKGPTVCVCKDAKPLKLCLLLPKMCKKGLFYRSNAKAGDYVVVSTTS